MRTRHFARKAALWRRHRESQRPPISKYICWPIIHPQQFSLLSRHQPPKTHFLTPNSPKDTKLSDTRDSVPHIPRWRFPREGTMTTTRLRRRRGSERVPLSPLTISWPTFHLLTRLPPASRTHRCPLRSLPKMKCKMARGGSLPDDQPSTSNSRYNSIITTMLRTTG